MRRLISVTAVIAAAATLTASAPGGGARASAATRGTQAAPGAQLWVARYNGRANSGDGASSVAVSPSGSRVFVTGASHGGQTTGFDYATVAYSATTGKQLWVRRYNGSANGADDASSVTVSPSGTRVFVTGESFGRRTGYDYATVAYSAGTGKQLWVRRYNGPATGLDAASSVTVSRGGSTVFVTGRSAFDYATVAYDAATGRQLWVRRYNGPANRHDFATSVAVSPGGAGVFVTGYSYGGPTSIDYATVAYSAAGGGQLWARRYSGPANMSEASSVAVSPAGTTVYVTGFSDGQAGDDDYATVAYSTATGRRLWVSRFTGPANSSACCVAVNPVGTTVFVTGVAYDSTTGSDYATVAYRG
jgi:outer membrane protein assembly factor BamB